MKKLKEKKIWFLSFLFAGCVLAFFMLFLDLTKNETEEIYLTPGFNDSSGWEFYTYEDNQKLSLTPKEVFELQNQVYYLSRTLDEAYAQSGITQLKLSYSVPCALFLDDTLFYTNVTGFSGKPGSLTLPEMKFQVPAAGETVLVTLPPDYAGKTLTCATINANTNQLPSLMLTSHSIRNRESAATINRTMLPASLLAFSALLLLGIWIYGGVMGRWSISLLPLILAAVVHTFYFLRNFGVYFPSTQLFDIPFIYLSRPLFVYLPMIYLLVQMKKYKKICAPFILIPALITVLLELILAITWQGENALYAAWKLMLPALLLLIAYSILEMRNKNNIFQVFVPAFTAISVSIFVIFIISLLNTGVFAEYLTFILNEYFSRMTIPTALINWVGMLLFILCILVSLSDLIRRTSENQMEIQALSLRNQLAQDNLYLMKQSSEELAKLRHNMLHHYQMLAALNQRGEQQHVSEYLDQIIEQTNQILPLQICPHPIINAIVANALDRAKKADIEMKYQINVPAELAIADVDLCNYLMNLLDNAVEAASLLPDKNKRRINFIMHVRGRYLFIEADNSYIGTPEQDDQGLCRSTKGEHHGYGMKTMLDIAQRYHSDLQVEVSLDTFLVRTALLLNINS